jgi:RNA polymerase-binding transcription factor DksA
MAASTKAAAKATKAPAKKAAGATPTKKAATNSTKTPAAKKTTVKRAAPAKKAVAKKAAPTKKAAPAKAAVKKDAERQIATPPKLPGAARGGQAVKAAPPKRKGPLDKFLIGQRESLTQERETYTRQAASLKAEADLLVAEREPGDVQFDEESGEGDTLAVERERDLALSAQAAAAVEEIDIALAKIKDGTYGVCEQCHNTIPKERLRALPFAALCVQCKSAGFSRR